MGAENHKVAIDNNTPLNSNVLSKRNYLADKPLSENKKKIPIIPSLELINPQNSKKIIKHQNSSLTYQLKHPKDQWVVIKYHLIGGEIKDNSASYEELKAGILKIEHTFKVNINLINLTMRNLTFCLVGGFSEQKCLGPHTLKPFATSNNLDLEINYLNKIIAFDSEAEATEDKITLFEDVFSEFLKNADQAAREACEGFETKNFQISISQGERTGKLMAIAGEGLETFMQNRDWMEAALYFLAGHEVYTQTEDRKTTKHKKEIQKKYEECLIKFRETFLTFD